MMETLIYQNSSMFLQEIQGAYVKQFSKLEVEVLAPVKTKV